MLCNKGRISNGVLSVKMIYVNVYIYNIYLILLKTRKNKSCHPCVY